MSIRADTNMDLVTAFHSSCPIAIRKHEIMLDHITAEAGYSFLKVVFIDLALAGDNAIVIAVAAAGLPEEQRRRALVLGIAAAAVMRIAFASVAVQMLNVIGLTLAGGILLLWVCWKLWCEVRAGHAADDAEGTGHQPKTLKSAIAQIIIADLSMSLDNVLAVAGAAREHPVVLVFGLILSIALMAFAATLIARLLQRHSWIAYIGLAVILYVALEMIVSGGFEAWSAASLMF
jgi:YjbE family integral membrane protein